MCGQGGGAPFGGSDFAKIGESSSGNLSGKSIGGVSVPGFMQGSKDKDWMNKLKKFGAGAQGGIMDAFNQEPIQSAPFQFSPLTQPEPDVNGSPLTQSIIASLMQQMSGRQGG